MPKKNKLTILLIRQELVDFNEIMKDSNNVKVIDENTSLYFGESIVKKPQWAIDFLIDYAENEKICVANARAVLLKKINLDNNLERIFAIVMGYGNNMLNDDVIEERFGLKVALNSIEPDSLRRINRTNIGGSHKITHEQLPSKSKIDAFDLDINRDLVSQITGVCDDFIKGTVSGNDALFCTAEVDITNINDFLVNVYNCYKLNSYKAKFAWIDQIQSVKSQSKKDELNKLLIDYINDNSEIIWMAVPDIIDWEKIRGFKYGGNDIFDDIEINEVKKTFKKPLSSIEQLKNKYILAVSTSDDSTIHRWSAFKCIVGEISVNGKVYCINAGKWYCIEDDFVKEVNNEYDNSTISNIRFPERTSEHSDENAYTVNLAQNKPFNYLTMDRKNIVYGGGKSQIELCDLITNNQELIHLKPYSGSSTLSHLFNQGTISAELLISDINFLNSANEKIEEQENGELFKISDPKNIKVIFGIISKKNGDLPKIPFFSKVAFRHTKNILNLYGLKVEIINIFDAR